MDGYASKTSSVVIGGLKKSLPSHNADIVVGDVDVLKTAPTRMAVSGIGDMLAKYVSICEWRIANLITGEYYCEKIASLVRDALKKCTDNIEGLLAADEECVQNVFDALCISSVAMNYAGVSRPASGLEHYISHIIDMRSEEFGTPADLHGIQCGIATLISARLYERLATVTPDRERAIAYVDAFDYGKRAEQLCALLGKGAESMIALEATEGKFDKAGHAKRLDIILNSFDKINEIAREEIPHTSELISLFERLGLETDYSYLGLTREDTLNAFIYSADIRDKYVLSRLFWDLGITDIASEVI
jgi:glycerol-1-phosphate dehydrogenase [NAD(P)+]